MFFSEKIILQREFKKNDEDSMNVDNVAAQ